ncbi:MAG: universal stress protein [Anaerolineae bacterium]
MKILLCVAGMPYAEAAVSFGSIIAGVTKSPVTLLHVAHRKKDRAAGERILAAAREMLPGLTVEMRIRQGDPVRQILAEVQEGHYDLTVVGARQGGGLTQQLLGSVAQKVVRCIPTSVVVAREIGPVLSDVLSLSKGPAEGPSLERVLICTGGKDVAVPVIEAGAWLAEAAHAQATLLHVTSFAPGMYTGLHAIEETLPRLLQTDTPTARHLRRGAEILERHQVTAKLRLRQGIAADEILRETREGDYDLVVIGASGAAGRLREWLLGNVTRQIVEHSPHSVLVVKQ